MHVKKLITPPPPGMRKPLTMKQREELQRHKRQGSGRGLHAAAPRTLLATSGVAGPKGGWTGTIGSSTGAWHQLRALCYQHPKLADAFDGETVSDSSLRLHAGNARGDTVGLLQPSS